MLKQRIITAIVLLAVVLSALLAPVTYYWQALVAVLVLLGFREWLSFCKIDSMAISMLAYAALIGLSLILYYGVLSLSTMVHASIALWIVLLIFTFTSQPAVLENTWVKLAVGIWVLAVSGNLLVMLKAIDYGYAWILLFIASICCADVGAYFTGKRFGKNKLAPSISPGKTIEGLLGGLVVAGLVTSVLAHQFFANYHFGLLLSTIMLTVIVSVGGDLYESKLKRFAGLKDSSQILPGHGGILDRIDSLVAGLPFFLGGLILLDVL